MADAKITALTELTLASVDDLLAIVDDPGGSPITKKITIANLLGDIRILASDTTISVSAMTNISAMCVALTATGLYAIDAMLIVNRGAASGTRFGLSFPSATLARGMINVSGSVVQTGLASATFGVAFNGNSASGSAIFSCLSTTNVSAFVRYSGLIKVGTVGGNINLMGGNAATAQNTVYKAGSFLKVMRIA